MTPVLAYLGSANSTASCCRTNVAFVCPLMCAPWFLRALRLSPLKDTYAVIHTRENARAFAPTTYALARSGSSEIGGRWSDFSTGPRMLYSVCLRSNRLRLDLRLFGGWNAISPVSQVATARTCISCAMSNMDTSPPCTNLSDTGLDSGGGNGSER